MHLACRPHMRSIFVFVGQSYLASRIRRVPWHSICNHAHPGLRRWRSNPHMHLVKVQHVKGMVVDWMALEQNG